MKRVLIFLISIFVIAYLFGCSSGNPNTGKTKNADSVESANSDTLVNMPRGMVIDEAKWEAWESESSYKTLLVNEPKN